ncbi:MAG: PIN domain-containing protein [Pseudonocardiaceae bacterium]|nr:PIN domain-containing protein [Pseudonocardiaceae bacterium]
MIYLDTSALVKLVIEEAESERLESWLVERDELITTSEFARVELVRACRRAEQGSVSTARALLADIPLVPLTPSVIATAEDIGSPLPRALDALHLGAAVELGDALSGFVAYDKRLRDAAKLVQLPAAAPP